MNFLFKPYPTPESSQELILIDEDDLSSRSVSDGDLYEQLIKEPIFLKQ